MESARLVTLVIITAAVATRWSVSLSPYSGAGKPPMFGDYEAQRHWMEITYHLPISDWYHNTTDNDLQYWGLDYPPLTAYHSWLCGYVADKINPNWVTLHNSRGHESYHHKLFMRYTVLVADLLVYIPAVLAYYFWAVKGQSNVQRLVSASCVLLYPGLILIDYGHFQFNNVSLGLTLWAVVAMATNHELLGAVAFVFALNYKQMELYHALPFFCFLLGRCLRPLSPWRLIKIGVFTVAAFALCWSPFITDRAQIFQVLHRIFPFARGLFEDKVSNVWCSLNILVKLRNQFSQDVLLKLSLISTLVCLLPSSLDVLLRPSIQKFKYALINSSLIFFLLSYQVHEKTILVVALPVCLFLHEHPLLCTWFLFVSVFSMLPLLIKDGLILPTLALVALFIVVSKINQSSWVNPPGEKQAPSFMYSLSFASSIIGFVCLTISSLFIQPPPRYPDLWPVLISLISCGHFVLFLLAFHYQEFASVYRAEAPLLWSSSSSSSSSSTAVQGHGKQTSRETQRGKSKKGGKRKQKTHKAD